MLVTRCILVMSFVTFSLAQAKKGACPIKDICKRIRMVQKKLKEATEGMTTQGKMISGRLDLAEGKIDDIGNIGKKLTDLLSQQGNKIKEQGEKLAAEETKLGEQMKAQMTTYTTKLDTFTTRVAALTQQNLKLSDLVTAQDGRIGSLQTEGVKVLDKLTGTTKKLEGKILAQTAKLSAQLPLPDGKFTEIAKSHATCTDKMGEFQAKFDGLQGMIAGLKEKLSNAETKLNAIGDTHLALGGKADVVGTDIDAQETAMADIAAKLTETDAKIGDVAAQGALVADNLAQATAKVGAVAAAKLKMKDKLTKQMETATSIKEQALSVAAKMKEHEMKLGKVQAELDKPKDPPPAPAAVAAATAPAPPGEAADKVAEEMEKMEGNLKEMTDLEVEPPFPVTLFMEKDGQKIEKGNEVGFLPNLPKIFDVSFDIQPSKFEPGWHSVLHFTQDGNCCNIGQRVPGIWYNNNRLYTSFAIGGNGNHGLFHGKDLEVSKWVKVRVSQAKDGEIFLYRIWQNDELLFQIENKSPADFKDVNMLVADPWYPPQQGLIRSLVVDETSYSCSFFSGDGSGGSEDKIGTQTGDECVKACVALKKTDNSINGVSVLQNGEGGCWCEKKMTGASDSDKYKTCFLVSTTDSLTCNVPTTGGTAGNGACCTFPFTYKGKTYSTCTNAGHDQPWCYTESDSSKWGNCEPPNPIRFYQSDDGVKLEKNKQIGFLPTLPKVFEISYDIKPTGFEAGWHSVLHITTGGNCCAYGQRIPGIWFNNNKLMTSFSVSGNGNWWKWHGDDVPKDQWTSVKLTQTAEEDGKFMFRVFHGDKMLFEVENTQVQEFKKVEVWMGDPWYAPQAGFVRKVKIGAPS